MLMQKFQTLAEIRAQAIFDMERHIEDLCMRLQSYAQDHGGSFILFGSAASRKLNHDSDVDLIIDFPDDKETDAWRFAESMCWERKLKPDIRPIKYCSEKLLNHILASAQVIS
jgi:predicted nucleotidyltransferase